jgi:hypothetical protein
LNVVTAAPTNTVIKPVGVTEKTTAQVALLTQTIRANDLFRALDPQQIAAIVYGIFHFTFLQQFTI